MRFSGLRYIWCLCIFECETCSARLQAGTVDSNTCSSAAADERYSAPLMNDWFVGFDFAVANVDDAVGPLGNIVFMRDQDNRVAIAVQPREQGHDFIAGFCIQITGRLVG